MKELENDILEMEACVLGTVIADEKASSNALELLSEASFTTAAHCAIYKAAKCLYKRFDPIDPYTVGHEMGRNGDLGKLESKDYLTGLVSKASPRVAGTYITLLKDAHRRRELKAIGKWLQEKAGDVTVPHADINRELELRSYRLKNWGSDTGMHAIKSALGAVLRQIEHRGSQEQGMSGIPSGYMALDRITSGWQKGSLSILGGRPAMGKSSFLIGMAKNIAVEFALPVAYFSLELSVTQVTERLVASLSGLDIHRLRMGRLSGDNWDELHSSIAGLSGSNLFIDDTPNLTLFDFRDKCRILKANSNIDMVIIDYLQLMRFSERHFNSRERELAEICRGVKSVARELDIAIIASSQLSRAVETRGGDKRPMLSDLRESGSLEQDADVVVFLYRPEYYGITEDWDGKSTAGTAELIVSKNRLGATGVACVKFDDGTAHFSDMEKAEDDPEFSSLREQDFIE